MPVAAVLDAPWFDAYLATFAPGAKRSAPLWYESERNGTRRWTHHGASVDVRRALAAPLAAVTWDDGEPMPLEDADGSPFVRAVALHTSPDALTPWFCIDLDGGYPPLDVVQGLRQVFGPRALLATSGSGRPGRFRVWGRLSHPRPVARVQAIAGAVLESIGFPAKNGSAEVFPKADRTGRLPFGPGCSVFDSATLTTSRAMRPEEAFRAFQSRPLVNLEAIACTLPGPVSPPTRERERVTRAVADTARRTVSESQSRADCERWRAEGVQPGESDAAVYALACECLYRCRLTEREAIGDLHDLAAGGAFARTDLGKNPRQLLAKIARVVRVVYRTHPAPGRPRPVNLGEREVLEAVAAVHALHPRGSRGAVLGVACALSVLPTFKGFHAAGLAANGVRLSLEDWRTLGVRLGGEAVAAREACGGMFVELAPYVPPYTAALTGQTALARTYRAAFTFDPAGPVRSLVPTRGRTPAQVYRLAVQLVAAAER